MDVDQLFEIELLDYSCDYEHFFSLKNNKYKIPMLLQKYGKPFLLKPDNFNHECVVLIHGLLSSPMEMRSLANKLVKKGFLVIGVRLKGHGTSPWDLLGRSWQDWQQSIERSIAIAQNYSNKIHLVGFSTGSLLALNLTADQPDSFCSTTACSPPIYLKDPLVKFVKFINGLNFILNKISANMGFLFKQNSPEHPHINYSYIPIAATYELLKLTANTRKKLNNIDSPVLLLQADNDPVVAPVSLTTLLKKISGKNVFYQWVSSSRHGILFENTANCQEQIINFICSHSK